MIVGNAKIKTMIGQFFDFSLDHRFLEVKEGDTLSTGEHTFKFYFAPMVHWPEVMMVYDEKSKALFSSDPKEQLMAAVKAVFRSWDNPRANVYRRDNDIPYSWGTAVNVQMMAFGNMGETSGTGVAFTRDPATGEKKLMGEFLMNAQGEDVVAGVRTPQHIDQLKETLIHFFTRHLIQRLLRRLHLSVRVLPLHRVLQADRSYLQPRMLRHGLMQVRRLFL